MIGPPTVVYRWRYYGLRIGFSLALTCLLLELAGAWLIHSGRIPAEPPRYAIPKPKEPRTVDYNPDFGAWYLPHRRHVHRRACFTAVYETTSYGAVDRERTRETDGDRTVVLGDSFAMGHGVNRADRVSEQLEALTGSEHMNFGLSGANHIQYYLIYKHLARAFEHNTVLVFLLPDNDLTDGPREGRYWAYWDGEGPDFVLKFSVPRPEDSIAHPSRLAPTVSTHDALGALSYTYAVADWVAGYLKVLRGGRDRHYAGYFDYPEEQLQKLRYSLRVLREEADHRRLIVVLIPRLMDFLRYDDERRSPIAEALSADASELSFELIDLLPEQYERHKGRWKDLFLGCDGHWSPLGHSDAAKLINSRLES